MTGDDAPEEFVADRAQPLIYVSVPLAPLRAVERGEDEAWSAEVAALLRATKIPSWEPQIYSGLELFRDSPEDAESDTAAERVFRLNSNAAWSYADALIIFRVSGGSTGVGVELAWAWGLGIPILYLHPASERVSRLVRGMRSEADLVIVEAGSPEVIHDAVERFLLQRQELIEDLARRRSSWHQRLHRLQRTLEDAWASSSEDKRAEAAAVARLTQARARRLATDVSSLGAATLREVSALAAAVGIDFGSGPDLHPHQMRSLRAAAVLNDWTGDQALQLYEIGRLEVAQPTQNRWALDTADEWEDLFSEYLERRQTPGDV